MQRGDVGVTAENIFPVIKEFLYSDRDIFLCEMVSNTVDATQELKTLSAKGDLKGESGDLSVRVSLDEKAGALTISDHGIGMTTEETKKYINQIAFSGVNDFPEEYQGKTEAVVGHFGLGLYSSFMVSKKVEIITKSYKEGSKVVKWSYDGSPEYAPENAEKEDRGSDIVLYVDDDCREFLQRSKTEELLDKYCKFMAVPIVFGKKTEWKDGKMIDTEEDNVINSVEPLWVKAPSGLKDEGYKSFHRTLFSVNDEPLFWIHLNVDYPFSLTGILYFPRVKNNIELQHNRIQLYYNQVFVTDQVKGIVPEFLTLFHDVIDSPDIPLNVSRSYPQGDVNVKEIATYIIKKVADRLQSIFKESHEEFEEKWDDLKLFINYGMLSESDFYRRAKDFFLIKDTEGKYFTLEEYNTLIKNNQTDKEGYLVNLYTSDKEERYSYIETTKQKGYGVIDASGQLDVPLPSVLEQKQEKTRYVRVNSDIVDCIIQKENALKNNLSVEGTDNLSEAFRSQIPTIEKADFIVGVRSFGESFQPILVTQSEYMRHMKEVSQFQQGMGFYAQLPDSYNLVLNAGHPLVKKVLDNTTANTADKLKPIASELKGQEARSATLHQLQDSKRAEELTQEEKDDMQNTQKTVPELQDKKEAIVAAYAKGNDIVHQLIDLALLQNGMLQGAALDKFLKRSISLIK